MPRSAQTTDNEDQLEDLVGSPNLMMPITTTHLEDDESEDGELGLSLIHISEPTRPY